MRGPSLFSAPSPVRPNDLRPRHRGRLCGRRGGRGRKSWPHVLSPEGRGDTLARGQGGCGVARMVRGWLGTSLPRRLPSQLGCNEGRAVERTGKRFGLGIDVGGTFTDIVV